MTSSECFSIGERSDDQEALEISILRALCRTVNADSSELKFLIIDTLSENDFESPLSGTIFETVTDMYRAGEYVVAANLKELLAERCVTIPDAFRIEELFEGDIPALNELTAWLKVLKERPGKKARAESIEERVRTLPVVADGDVASTNGGENQGSGARPAASRLVAVGDPAATQAWPLSETRHLESKAPPRKPTKGRAEAHARKTREPAPALPASEGEEWLSYLKHVSSNQLKHLNTGFAKWDDHGGLRPTLHLLVDRNRDRVCAFLKQVTDQVAETSQVPCLYISFRTPKATLRLRTLSRLTGLRADDIELGSFDKTAPEWKRVEEIGVLAAEWLRQVFIVEARANIELRVLRQMAKQLLSSSRKRTALILVDHLEGLGKVSASLLSGLKKVSESLGVPVVVATDQSALLSQASIELRASLSGEGTDVKLEIHRRSETPFSVSLDYDPDTYRFEERSDQ